MKRQIPRRFKPFKIKFPKPLSRRELLRKAGVISSKTSQTGPYVKNEVKGAIWSYQQGVRLPLKERKRVLSANQYYRIKTSVTPLPTGAYPSSDIQEALNHRRALVEPVHNRLFFKTQSTVEEGAQALLTAAESGKTLAMITTRAKQVAALATAVLTKKPELIAAAFGLKLQRPRGVNRAKKGIDIQSRTMAPEQFGDKASAAVIPRWYGNEHVGFELASGRKQKYDYVVRRNKANMETYRLVRPSDVAPHNVWLELQFGWKPLVEDLQKVAYALARNYANEKQWTYGRVSAKDSSLSYGFGKRSVDGSYLDSNGQLSACSRYRYRIVDDEKVRAQAIGVTNPAVLAWDLIPFSFVVDWFVPVNKFLNSLTAFRGIELQGLSNDKFIGLTTRGWRDYYTPGWPWNTSSATVQEFSRFGLIQNATLPTAPCADRLTLWHAVTSVALMTQQLGRLAK